MLTQQISHRRAKHLEIGADLVLENCVPQILREFRHSMYIGVVFLIPSGAGAVGQRLQLVPDALESSGMRLALTLAHNGRMDDAHSNRIVRRLDSSASPVAPAPILSLSNRARADPIFPLIPGSFYRHVSRCLETRIRRPTSCSFKNTFKEDFNWPTVRQPRR